MDFTSSYGPRNLDCLLLHKLSLWLLSSFASQTRLTAYIPPYFTEWALWVMTYDPPNFATLNGFTAHVFFLHELSLASPLGWLGNKSIQPINILASPSSLLYKYSPNQLTSTKLNRLIGYEEHVYQTLMQKENQHFSGHIQLEWSVCLLMWLSPCVFFMQHVVI